jgi:hypothetical protein
MSPSPLNNVEHTTLNPVKQAPLNHSFTVTFTLVSFSTLSHVRSPSHRLYQIRTKQPISNIAHTRRDISLGINQIIYSSDIEVCALWPYARYSLKTFSASEDGKYGDMGNTPVPSWQEAMLAICEMGCLGTFFCSLKECVLQDGNGSHNTPTSCNKRVNHKRMGDLGMLHRQLVIVLDRLQCLLVSKQTKMVDNNLSTLCSIDGCVGLNGVQEGA